MALTGKWNCRGQSRFSFVIPSRRRWTWSQQTSKCCSAVGIRLVTPTHSFLFPNSSRCLKTHSPSPRQLETGPKTTSTRWVVGCSCIFIGTELDSYLRLNRRRLVALLVMFVSWARLKLQTEWWVWVCWFVGWWLRSRVTLDVCWWRNELSRERERVGRRRAEAYVRSNIWYIQSSSVSFLSLLRKFDFGFPVERSLSWIVSWFFKQL